jgi:hypothetical protein
MCNAAIIQYLFMKLFHTRRYVIIGLRKHSLNTSYFKLLDREY